MIIHNRSCRGYETCFGAERTTVHGGSCIGKGACQALMLYSDVGKFSCIGDNACKSNLSCINTIIVGNDSCFGTKSCFEYCDGDGRNLGPVGSRSWWVVDILSNSIITFHCLSTHLFHLFSNGSYACNDSYGGSLGSCQWWVSSFDLHSQYTNMHLLVLVLITFSCNNLL